MRSIAFLSVFLFALAIVGYSQHRIHGDGSSTEITRDLPAFDKVHNSIFAEVVVTKGAKNSVRIEGEKNIIDVLITDVENGALVIKTPEYTTFQTTRRVRVTVTIAGELSEVSNSGSGGVRTDDLFKSPEMQVRNSGSGEIQLQVATDRLQLSMSGSGRVNLKGSAKRLDCAISGSGSVHGNELAVDERSEIHISGSGSCTITANGVIDASISGSGGINYLGNPSEVNVIHSGSGRARKIS